MTEQDWTMQMVEGGEVFPFVEDENANITGLGHQDKAAFADALNRYDAWCNGQDWVDESDLWTADHIAHEWATQDADGERLRTCGPTNPGAIAITTLWGAR